MSSAIWRDLRHIRRLFPPGGSEDESATRFRRRPRRRRFLGRRAADSTTAAATATSKVGGGLSDDIMTGLSSFSYLRVIARSSSLRYANRHVRASAKNSALGT